MGGCSLRLHAHTYGHKNRSTGDGSRLHLDDKLRVGVGESLEFILVQVHDEELVCGRQLDGHLGEFLVEVTGILPVLLGARERGRNETVLSTISDIYNPLLHMFLNVYIYLLLD